MALTINTNVAALNAHKNMVNNDKKLSTSLERLSTGLRINKAADDASGMIIADSLKAQHLGIGQAVRNANDGVSMLQTADGALQESINIVNTIKTKAIQAASDGQTSTTRTAIQNDIDKLMEELDTIAKTTAFNGQQLLGGAFTNKKIQIGAYANETANISIGSAESTKTGHITQAKLELASDSGGQTQLTITSAITGEELTLNEIDIQANNKAENGMGALADEVNRYAAITGINATAVVESTTDYAIAAGTTGSGFAINGINIGAITTQANDADGALAKAINGKTAEHGVSAAVNEDGTMTLTSTDGRAIEVSGSVSDVFGSTNTQMSTLGHLNLTQKGVSQFQINGIGAGATGADITISGDVTTVEDSILAAGSTIATGSELASGSIVGGDALVESSIDSTQGDYQLKAGSTLYSTTEIAKGTVLGGSVTVGGDTGGTATGIQQDMLVTSGSTLKTGSVLGKGTVVTTAFSTTTDDFEVGDTLSSSVTLTSDLTLQNNMTLKYSSTGAENSKIMADSTLAKGTEMGVKLDIGYTYGTAGGTTTMSVGASTTADLYFNNNTTVSNTGGNLAIKAGSLLADDSTLKFTTGSGTATWGGPTLVFDSGTLEAGDTYDTTSTYTLASDQVISEDLTNGATAASFTLNSGSILTDGFTTDNVGSQSAYTATLETAVMADDMTLKSGSELAAGSKLLAGSELGDNTYVMGGSLDATADDLDTYMRTDLKANSTLQDGSIMAEGSTVGATSTVNADTTLESDMGLTAGSTLAAASLNGASSTTAATEGTMIEAGTLLNQDMVLYESAIVTDGTTATAFDLNAGDVLTKDLYVGFVNSASTSETDGITLSEDMVLKEDSVIGADSELAINTENAGTVGLSETESYRLADLNVLTQEGAQRAIDIAEAALADLDDTKAGLGSIQNQFTSTISNLSVTKTNIQASESAIRDVDFAEESMNFSRLQLLAQTGSYALAQANASSQNVLSLMQ